MLEMVTDTSIGISRDTKKRMESAKQYPRETFDDIINRILDIMDEKQEKQQRLDYP